MECFDRCSCGAYLADEWADCGGCGTEVGTEQAITSVLEPNPHDGWVFVEPEMPPPLVAATGVDRIKSYVPMLVLALLLIMGFFFVVGSYPGA